MREMGACCICSPPAGRLWDEDGCRDPLLLCLLGMGQRGPAGPALAQGLSCRKHDGVLSLHMPPGSLCPDPVTLLERKGGRKAGSPSASLLIWKGACPFLSLQEELGCKARTAGAERGSPAKECDISEAAATWKRGQRERSSPGAAQDGTGEEGGRQGPSAGTAQQAAGTRGTRTQAGGGAGAEGLGKLGVAAEHGVWVLHCTGRLMSSSSATSNPSTPPKNSPSLAHGVATFGAAAGGGEAVNRTAPAPGGCLCPGTPGTHPAPLGCRQGNKRGTVLLARGSRGGG